MLVARWSPFSVLADGASSRCRYCCRSVGRVVEFPSPAAEIHHEDEDEDQDQDEAQAQRQEQQQQGEEERQPATRKAAFPSDLVSPRVGAAGDGFHKKVHETRWVDVRCCVVWCGVLCAVSCQRGAHIHGVC